MVSVRHRLLFKTRGVLVTLPAQFHRDATKKPKGLEWEYQATSLDAAMTIVFHIERLWRGASEFLRWAACAYGPE
jgi:hypothetical protein